MRPEDWTQIKKEMAQDDKKAFARIYEDLWSSLYSVAYNYLRERATAEEMVQEVFVNLWIKRQHLQTVDNISAFAMRALQFQIYDYFDRKAVVDRYIESKAASQKVTPDTSHHQIEYDETLTLITQEIDNLPSLTQKIFRLSRFSQYSNEEIANHLHVSVKTVEYHITQSLKHLRRRLGFILLIHSSISLVCCLCCF
ncbi:MAG TPA: RNA polymerase sigma-70 factor [Chryseosolibacter sp.]|nr:RNA polymerase sigma-70 factor [Chryseosolibacter sp.]